VLDIRTHLASQSPAASRRLATGDWRLATGDW